MSECAFDPTAPSCVTDNIAAFAAAPETESAEEPKWDSTSPSDIGFTRKEISFGLACFVMLMNGVKMYQWYPLRIRNDNLNFPDRIENVVTHDQEWALGTREISAWTTASYLSSGLYGFGLLLWGLNMLQDNQGGRLHFYSYSWSWLLNWAPAILMFQALTINASYARDGTWYLNGIINDAEVGESDVALDKVAWLFNPAEVSDQYNKLDEERIRHQQMNAVAIVFTALVQYLAFPEIKATYEMRALDEEEAVEAEAEAEPEVAQEAEIEAAEDTFF